MVSERVYRALLVVYPAEYRREYGGPMVQLFRDRMRRDGGGFRTPVVWVRMVFDLLGSAFMEHRERATWESATVKRAAVRSGEFLLWSLVGAIGLYMVTTLAVVVASIVSLKTGWHTFTIETGFGVTQDAPREFWVMYRPDNTSGHPRQNQDVVRVRPDPDLGTRCGGRSSDRSRTGNASPEDLFEVVVGVRPSAIRGSHPQKVPLRQVRAHAAHEFANRL